MTLHADDSDYSRSHTMKVIWVSKEKGTYGVRKEVLVLSSKKQYNGANGLIS